MYWGMLYSAMGSTTKYWYLAERSAGQYWWHFSCENKKSRHNIRKMYISLYVFTCPRLQVRKSYPSHLSQFGQHDYDCGVVLPEHSPEVFCSLSQRALCCNVGLLLPVGRTPALKQITQQEHVCTYPVVCRYIGLRASQIPSYLYPSMKLAFM